MAKNKEVEVTEVKKAKPKKREPGFYVEKGRAITSRRGIIGEGKPVYEKDVHGGKERLKQLEDKGILEFVK